MRPRSLRHLRSLLSDCRCTCKAHRLDAKRPRRASTGPSLRSDGVVVSNACPAKPSRAIIFALLLFSTFTCQASRHSGTDGGPSIFCSPPHWCALPIAAAREWSMRQYLHGFSDAVVSASEPPEQKIEAILDWMRAGPSRAEAARPDDLSPRNPENTLNYRQLLLVCGSATNAFLNLSRSAGLESRRLLLLTPEQKTKHVVAEVLVDGRWIVVDPSFRIVMRDASGRALTRKELQNPAVLGEATRVVSNYPAEYSYDRYAHVRLARLPLDGFHLRKLLESILPGWDETLDWSLLLERESYFVLVITAMRRHFCC